MTIPTGVKQDFELLRKAFLNGNVSLIESADRTTHRLVYAVCVIGRPDEDEEDDGTEFTLIPFATLDPTIARHLDEPIDVHSSMGEHA